MRARASVPSSFPPACHALQRGVETGTVIAPTTTQNFILLANPILQTVAAYVMRACAAVQVGGCVVAGTPNKVGSVM